MRIVGGSSRGLKLAEVDAPGIRPTTDRIREALFNILAHDPARRLEDGPFPAGASVLDVFAGTGALGLEAPSRGAAQASFIENDPAALRLLKANAARLKAGERATVLQGDALKPRAAREPVDLVLMDPPYGEDLAGRALSALRGKGWIGPETLVVVETDRKDGFQLPDGFTQEREKDYGRTRLRFLRLL